MSGCRYLVHCCKQWTTNLLVQYRYARETRLALASRYWSLPALLCLALSSCGVSSQQGLPRATPDSVALYRSFDGQLKRLLACARTTNRVAVVAHRGGTAPGFPENSLSAVSRVLATVPALIELDVVRSSDGVLFLHHDDTLDRTTNGSGPFSEQRWSDVAQLSLIDNDGVVTSERPATLLEALAILRDRAFLLLDVKDASATEDVVALVRDQGMLQATVFIVYNLEQAGRVRSVESSAMLALGANSEAQTRLIYEAGFADAPFLALTGSVAAANPPPERLSRDGHFILGGSYVGANPPDARLETDDVISAFDRAANNGYQLVVSNRAIAAFRYLNSHGIAVDGSDCPAD